MANRPNILFIFDDQHRHDYLGAAGASFVNTPNLDRLAQRGMMDNTYIIFSSDHGERDRKLQMYSHERVQANPQLQ